jgi:hypothetical protein
VFPAYVKTVHIEKQYNIQKLKLSVDEKLTVLSMIYAVGDKQVLIGVSVTKWVDTVELNWMM